MIYMVISQLEDRVALDFWESVATALQPERSQSKLPADLWRSPHPTGPRWNVGPHVLLGIWDSTHKALAAHTACESLLKTHHTLSPHTPTSLKGPSLGNWYLSTSSLNQHRPSHPV